MNCLKELSENFPNYCISHQEAPSYVNAHWNVDNKTVILIYKKGQYTTCVSPKRKEQTTLISEFDLTGSPLKLDMAYDKLEDTFLLDVSQCWLREEISHQALTIEEARNVVNFYNGKIRQLPCEERVPLWVVCDGQDQQSTLLMAALSFADNFNRGIVVYLETTTAADLSVEKMKEMHLKIYGCSKDQPLVCKVSGTYRISGKRISAAMQNCPEEVLNKHYTGMTQLECEWTKPTLQVPIHETNINLVQQTIIGHELSTVTVLWKSVCALQGINSAILNLSSTVMPVKLEDVSIKTCTSSCLSSTREQLEARLCSLLKQVEEYGWLSWEPIAGCTCIAGEPTSLQTVFRELAENGSSNDFTYRLWDILKDCNTADDLITLLVYSLKEIYKRNMRPFIDPGNTTLIGVLVKKLARGSSPQALASLSNLYSNPSRALSIIGQLGLAKTCWEYTNIFTLVDSTLGYNDRLKLQNKASEVNEEVYNQTIMDMSLGSGDVSINPFDTKCNLMDSTFMQDPESTPVGHLADLTLDDFASLKKHNIHVKTEKKLPEKEQPLFSDEFDLEFSSKEWKFKLTRLAQLHTCLEHLFRTQQSLNSDFNALKPIAVQLLEYYTADNSPIKTVGQLRNEPVQTFTVPVQYKSVKEHLQFKHATSYRVTFSSQLFKDSENNQNKEPTQTITSSYVCSQQSVFPPSIYIPKDLPEDNESLYYHCTKYILLENSI